ncbi:MAG: sulfatase-like hydrolase/transferase [Acidobacteria bacterium]|nr:sulfatase-like hydrolase/transferase [Acidobacteriota bacterium]
MPITTSRRDLLRLFTAAPALALPAWSQTRKPNLLMLFADDMGWSDVGFNGRKEWKTPNLDRLASQGALCTRWYTGFPVCAPSRACLMTGKYTIHNTVRNNGKDLPASEVTIAEAVKPLGYKTALFGKWHKGNLPGGGFTHPLDQGFEETFGYLDARHAWEHFPKELYRGREKVAVSGFSCDLIVNEAVRFMKENQNNPFFLYLPFIEPHFYIASPEENVARYKGKFKEKDPAKPYNAHYAGMIERLDAAIGRVLKTLDDLKLAEHTLVVFTSDNGATFETGNQGASNYHDSNRPYRGQKRSLEEGGIRMPACVRWTGKIPAGQKLDTPFHTTDVFPSFLAAAGSKPDAAWKVDGMNMLDVWMGKAKAPERTLFWELQLEGWDMYAAMRGDFKYLRVGTNHFLYNVKDDPQERRTIGQEYPEMMKRLRAETDAWIKTEVKAQ